MLLIRPDPASEGDQQREEVPRRVVIPRIQRQRHSGSHSPVRSVPISPFVRNVATPTRQFGRDFAALCLGQDIDSIGR
jgi:hypothetical protein